MNDDAIGGEKQLKAGNRSKKETLIQIMNPNWDDLYENINDITTFQPFKEFYIINLQKQFIQNYFKSTLKLFSNFKN
jgi:hypothetical protein